MPRRSEVNKDELLKVQTTLEKINVLWSELAFTTINSLPPNVKNKINSAAIAGKGAIKAVSDFAEKLNKEANTV